ncbi:alpha/beta fold hydrolase [Actinoallomurus sp. NBC_01490]|uniref:alpha/beta fold hydrolase n=1 Tax=Actinoallomurus sp. NBC_01490 TaxID=2903557 RepID=UPI003FA40C70
MSPVSDSPSRPGRQTADAPTFVLVHGSGTSSPMWAPVQRELALRGHRGYAVDLPGHGAEYGPVVLVGASSAERPPRGWATRSPRWWAGSHLRPSHRRPHASGDHAGPADRRSRCPDPGQTPATSTPWTPHTSGSCSERRRWRPSSTSHHSEDGDPCRRVACEPAPRRFTNSRRLSSTQYGRANLPHCVLGD